MATNYSLDTTAEILGAMWIVKMCSEEEEPLLKDLGGFTDWTERLICLHNVPRENELGNPLENIKRNIRHEVIHAFMFESGLAENWEHKEMGQEEQTVDWIAMQMPKIEKVVDKIYGEIREVKGQDEPETEKPEERPAKKWVRIALAITASGTKERLQCPNCGFTHEFIDGHTSQYNYCPQCGMELSGVANAESVMPEYKDNSAAEPLTEPDYKDWHHYESIKKVRELEEIVAELNEQLGKEQGNDQD